MMTFCKFMCWSGRHDDPPTTDARVRSPHVVTFTDPPGARGQQVRKYSVEKRSKHTKDIQWRKDGKIQPEVSRSDHTK